MTKKIIKENKLIAEFMGYQYVEVWYYGSDDETEWQRKYVKWKDRVGMDSIGEYIVNIKKYKWYRWEEVAYHSSWDWLMPVVEKIESLEYEFAIYGKQFGQFPRKCRTFIYFDLKRHRRLGELYAEGKTPKEATYKAVIEFIKWHNKKYRFGCYRKK